MPDFDVSLRIRDLDGALLLELEDEANGYVLLDGAMPTEDHPWVGQELRSPWADGSSEGFGTRDSSVVSIQVEVSGATWVQVQQRVKALTDVVASGEPWLLEEYLEGVSKVWRAGRVSPLIPPVSPGDLLTKRQIVTLTFTTQPTPTITGLEP